MTKAMRNLGLMRSEGKQGRRSSVSTRRATEGAPLAYERYMSSPEFADLRGIPGSAVAAKAQLYPDARKRSLLFFLQSLSLKEGGLRRVAQALVESALQTSQRGISRLSGRDLH